MQIKTNKKTLLPAAAETKKSVEARFAWATGTERLYQHDPLYHVTESFQQNFDRIGRSHAQAAAGGFHEGPEQAQTEADGQDQTKIKKQQQPETATAQTAQTAQTARGAHPKERQAQTDPFSPALTRFSDIAFRRGAMSAAVLNGTGKMMLISCLRRSAVETGPKRLQQQTVSGIGSSTWAIPGHTPDQVVFNRGFTDSALGIVVDTLRDSRRIVESMTELARGSTKNRMPGQTVLFKIYPFLDDSRDAELEAEYRDRLAKCTDEREKPVLQNALVQTLSLRAKKAQMKNEFISKLRFLQDRATETLAELEAPGMPDELAAAAFGEQEVDLPENPEEGADGDAPNRKKNRADKAKQNIFKAKAAETANP